MRLIRHARWPVLLAVPALAGLALAGPAAAGTGGKAPTAACQAFAPNCTEPVVAKSPVSSLDTTPSADAAMTAAAAASGTPVTINPSNNKQDGTQDWDFVFLGNVPLFGQPGFLGLNNFDKTQYGGDGIYAVEFAPFGQDTGLCLTNVPAAYNTEQLRSCTFGPRQAWIVDFSAPLFLNPPPAPYAYALNVKRDLSVATHHLCLSAPSAPQAGGLDAERCRNFGPGQSTFQQWSALP